MTRLEALVMTVLAHESGDEDAIRLARAIDDDDVKTVAHEILTIRAEQEGRRMEVQS